MAPDKEQLRAMLEREDFPLSLEYDPQWIIENQMGPNALWLTEWLCRGMHLVPGMRVLDMGCGKAMSSIFLAKEYDVKVWANDLWIGATDNWHRIQEAQVENQVFPIHADARSLPYAEKFFDAAVCVDSYFYYGTDDLYLNYFVKFVKPRGRLGIVLPGLMQDFDGALPEYLKPFWAQECWGWHTAEWWRHLWERTGLVDIELAERMPDGCHLYLQWKKALAQAARNEIVSEEHTEALGERVKALEEDVRVLQDDNGEYIGFIRVIARRKSARS